MSRLKELAQHFVEDDLSAEEQDKIITEAADYVKSGAPAMELALSIQRWMSKDDPDDHVGDVERNAKAHTFVARTLKALPQDLLRAKEVQVFAGFFGSMYAIGGNSWPVATDALATLAAMHNCSTSAVDDIFSSMADIDPENFKKQLAKTRLDIFLLFGQFLARGISEPRQRRASVPTVIKLAKWERDPNNLLRWFSTLSNIIRPTKLSDETANAVFESFSPFFPISIRASTSKGNVVSEQELKDALRSCFAANGQLARLALPFLLGKLDDGTSSMTAAVKVDILETIKACVVGYEPCDSQVVPHIPQIWSSLKYEVRNGESPEAIQETLSVFEAISRRLAKDSPSTSLQAFVDSIWNDSIEDLADNPAYTEQLGSILISVARAHLASFRLISPRLSQAIRLALSQPKTSAHTKSLLLVLNNLLRVRRQLAPCTSGGTSPETYEDGPVSPLRGIFFKLFNENAVDNPNAQQVDLAKEALLGLEQLVKQRRPRDDATGYETDCDEDAFQEICTTLSFHFLNCFNRPAPVAGSSQEGLESAVGQALLAAVQHHPQGYGKIVSDVLDDVKKTNWTGTPAKRSLTALNVSCMRLAYLGCAVVPEDAAAIVNFATFAGAMLQILGSMFASKASLAACALVIAAVLKGLRLFVNVDEVRSHLDALQKSEVWEQPWDISTVDDAVKNTLPTFPDLAAGQFDQFDPTSLTQVLSKSPKSGEEDFVVLFLQLSLFIVRQLYQHATMKVEDLEIAQLDLSVPLTAGLVEVDGQSSSNALLWRDRYLNVVARIAATVLRQLNVSAQTNLLLHQQLLACFRPFEDNALPLSWGYHRSAAVRELSWGVALAIRPEVVLKLHDNIGTLLIMEADGAVGSSLPVRSRIAEIVTLLTNKYDTRTPTPMEEARKKHGGWIQVLAVIEAQLKDTDTMANMTDEKLFTITGILWGAIARGDRFVTKGLQDAIGRAAGKSNDIARLLARIFSPLEKFLCPGDAPAYLISKPLSGQRAYYHCVRPVLPEAYPGVREAERSVSLAVYILHSVKQLSVSQYEQDAEKIFRIAVTAMPQAKHAEDIDAAASVVHHIIQHRTALAKQNWKTVLTAARAMYNNAHPFQDITCPPASDTGNLWAQSSSVRHETEEDRTELRKKSLRLSALVAQKTDRLDGMAVEELMHLTSASGDKIREIRALVLKTRSSWMHLVNLALANEE